MWIELPFPRDGKEEENKYDSDRVAATWNKSSIGSAREGGSIIVPLDDSTSRTTWPDPNAWSSCRPQMNLFSRSRVEKRVSRDEMRGETRRESIACFCNSASVKSPRFLPFHVFLFSRGKLIQGKRDKRDETKGENDEPRSAWVSLSLSEI